MIMASVIDASTYERKNIVLERKLCDISQQLNTRDTHSIVFLFHDELSKNDNSKLTIRDILLQLYNVFGDDFIRILSQCLCRIDRNDLLYLLEMDPDDVRMQINRNTAYFSRYRLLLFEIADALTSPDLKRLLDEEKNIHAISPHAFINSLEKSGTLGLNNFWYFKQLLMLIHRADLAKKIDDEAEYLSFEYTIYYPETSLESKLRTDEQDPCVELLNNVSIGSKESVSGSNIGSFPSYKMTAETSGLCVIINNENFLPSSGLGSRPGSSLDEGNLKKTFTRLSFEVVTMEDLSGSKMVESLGDIANMNHSHYDAFVCCILTHGKYEELHGVDGELVPVTKLTSLFTPDNCPSLVNKPKIFFLQACRGTNTQLGIEIDGPDSAAGRPRDPPTIPLEADFLYGYATVLGYVSYRYTQLGSWYILTLTRLLDHYTPENDLLSILTGVNYYLSRNTAYSHYKMVAAPQPTLRKKVFFKVKS